MVTPYVPEAGDIVWLQFDPQAGREQAGDRAALVLSPASYNRIRGMMICCPMTSRIKGYPFEVSLGAGFPVRGVILADQLKSFDWRIRRFKFICKADQAAVRQTRELVAELLGT